MLAVGGKVVGLVEVSLRPSNKVYFKSGELDLARAGRRRWMLEHGVRTEMNSYGLITACTLGPQQGTRKRRDCHHH